MSIVRRAASERGHVNIGWLESRHSFSFGQYHDPQHMGYRTLRVINEDRVQPGEGFGQHGHRDMEIVSYVVSGNLAHADSLGSRGELRRGDVQAMSAGTGIEHSEFNGSDADDVHFLQIWILPRAAGLPTAYAQTHVPDNEKRDRLKLLVSPDGVDASLRINQDARLYASLLGAGKSLVHPLAPGRGSWVQVISGRVVVNGQELQSGDGAAVDGVTEITLAAAEDSELLLFDLA